MAGNVEQKDRRALVLLALGAGVAALNWIGPGPAPSLSDFTVTASKNGQQYTVYEEKNTGGSTLQLSAQTACADTPAQLALFFNLPMPVNLAGSKDLVMLPGIGPRMAERILDFRAGQGSITGPEDLVRIQGFGPVTMQRLLPLICFDSSSQ